MSPLSRSNSVMSSVPSQITTTQDHRLVRERNNGKAENLFDMLRFREIMLSFHLHTSYVAGLDMKGVT